MRLQAAPRRSAAVDGECVRVLVNAVTYTFPAGRADEAAALLLELRDASRLEPGCRGYDVGRSNDDPRVFVLHEIWADRAALDAHFAAEHFIRLGVRGIRELAESRVAHLCTPLGE